MAYVKYYGGQAYVLLNRPLNRDPGAETHAVPAEYQETVTIHDREFQKYSIDNSIHLVPIDDVFHLLN